MREIRQYRTTDSITKKVHLIEIRPFQPRGWTIWIDGEPGFSGLSFTDKEVNYKIGEYSRNPRIHLEFLGQRADDTISEEDRERLKSAAARLHKATGASADPKPKEGDTTMAKTATKKKTARKPAAPAESSKPTIFGLKLTAFVHWMRDKGFSLAEGRHVIKSQGFAISATPPKAGEKGVRDHSIRAHFSEKCCAAPAPSLPAETAATVLKLKKHAALAIKDAKKAAAAAKTAAGGGATPKPRKKAAKASKATKKRASKPAGKEATA